MTEPSDQPCGYCQGCTFDGCTCTDPCDYDWCFASARFQQAREWDSFTRGMRRTL